MQKRWLLLISGVILALVVAVLIMVYLDQSRKALQEQLQKEAEAKLARSRAEQVAVLVAKRDIPQGAPISAEMFDTKIVQRDNVVPQVATSLDRISGMVTIAPIVKDEQVSLSKLSYPKTPSPTSVGGLASATPIGKRAITINVDNAASLAGMVKPGDHVDIMAMLPVPSITAEGKQTTQGAVVPLFQDVLILAVGQQMGVPIAEGSGRYDKENKQAQPAPPSGLITIALNPQEASLIAFVQEQGRLRLVLRSPADSQTQALKPISWDALFQYVIPAASKQAPKQESEQMEYVEIYRGMKKDRIPLLK